MWWRTERGDKIRRQSFRRKISDKISRLNFTTGISRQGFCNSDFVTQGNLALRCYRRGKTVIHSGLCPTTITADFALGKTVS
jgi:hypothetical protein